MCIYVLVAQSCLTLCNPWAVAHQAPLSMKFSRQESRDGLPFASPGDLPDRGIKPTSPALQSESILSEPPGNVGWFFVFFFFCPIPSSSPPPVPALSPTASENSPALDNSLGIPQGWNSHFQSAIQLIRRKLHRGGVNKKIIRNPFWSFLLKSRHVFLLPLPKSTASHTSSICLRATPFLQLVLMPQREFATPSHPSIIFLGKKKFPPAIKWQLSTLSTELLGNCSSCQLG